MRLRAAQPGKSLVWLGDRQTLVKALEHRPKPLDLLADFIRSIRIDKSESCRHNQMGLKLSERSS